MPELPDVQLFKKYFDATSLGKKITAIDECDSRLLQGISGKKLQQRLTGKSFTATRRHGKYLFARLDENGFLVLHFGMTGFLRAFRKEEKAPDHVGLLVRFGADDFHLAVVSKRRLGRIAVTGSVEEFVEKQELGPDALALCRDEDSFRKRLDGSRGTVKGWLMNQKKIAGIGNIYSDEILFFAGLHPKRNISDLDKGDKQTLAGKTRHVLETAIDKKAGEEGWPESWLLPRRKEGKSCPRCGGKIRRIKIAGRGAYYCPEHQH